MVATLKLIQSSQLRSRLAARDKKRSLSFKDNIPPAVADAVFTVKRVIWLDGAILQSFKCRRVQSGPATDNLFFLKTKALFAILR